MSHNILSGNVSTPADNDVDLSGAFSGDGTDLTNVSHFKQTNSQATRVSYYDSQTAPGPLGNQFDLKGHGDFTFDDGTSTLTVKTGSLERLSLTDIQSGSVAGGGSYLALNASNEVILTSSAGGEITIKDEGSDLTTAVASIDFVGSGVTATNSGNDVTVTIDGGGGGSATAAGPTGSLQFHKEDGEITGSTNLLFVTSSNTLNLTGTLNVSGAINTNELNINVTNKTVINLEASGSTKFGDTDDDTHQFTGSILVNGSIIRARESVTSFSYTISATDYVIGVDTATIGAASTINLPVANTLQDGQFFIIKDEGGDAQTYNIKITASAADLIDGVSEVYLESPYGAISIYTNGSDKFFIY